MRLDNPRRPHLGVFGATGAGKTNALTYLLLQASLRPPDELQLVVIDPRDRLGVSDHFPNRAYERERTVEGARDALLHIRNLLAERDNDHRPRLLVVIDELGTVLARDDLLIHAFEDIIGQGRNVGIYLAVADQKPLAREIGSRGRAQIGQRLVGPVEHRLERTMVAGSSVAGSKAPGGGAFWLVHLHPPRALHIQVPLVTPEDEEQWRARPPWKIERIPQPAPEDELYPEVAEFVDGCNVVSQNDIRREFRIGVPRAQRLVKTLTEHGVLTGERAEDNSGYIVRKGD